MDTGRDTRVGVNGDIEDRPVNCLAFEATTYPLFCTDSMLFHL